MLFILRLVHISRAVQCGDELRDTVDGRVSGVRERMVRCGVGWGGKRTGPGRQCFGATRFTEMCRPDMHGLAKRGYTQTN